MIEFIQNFHFIRPWVLLFFILPLLFYFKIKSSGGMSSSWENICDKNLLEFLRINNENHKQFSVKKYVYLGLIAAILGAAGPTWKKKEIPTFTVENPSLFVLSLSKEMQMTDISPSRLNRAKFLISDITDSLENGQFGLMVYSQEPYVITPLSDDAKLIKNLLPQISADIVPDFGDRLDRAIDLAVERFKNAGYSSGNIIVFASDVGQRLDFALEKVNEAARLNYDINIVDTSYSGNDKLQMLAQKGNGLYLHIKNASIQPLLKKLQQTNQDKIQLSQNLRSDYVDYGYYLIFISLLCLLPFFRRGLLVFFLVFCLNTPVYAGFLQNDNQEGLSLFNKNEYESAYQKFKNPVWRGISLYRQEKNEEALREFSQDKSSIALYNKGVVLTKLCKYQEAINAFDEALKLDSSNDDARYNVRLLQDLLEKAKDDKSLIDCNNNQQQQQNNQQSKEQNQNQEQNQQQNNNNQNSQDNQSKENSNENQENQNQDDKQDSSDKDNQEQNENDDNQKQEQNEDENQNNSPSTSNNSNEESEEQQGSASDANQDNGPETKTNNQEGDENNGSEEQQEEVEAQMVNAKKGEKDDNYDEEALAVQRRYREIPEDTGGLLREFIKKEYLKDRYHDKIN